MRKTVHLIATEDAGWMLPLFEPTHEKWSRTRLGQLGMPARTVEKGLRLIAAMLADEGPMTRNAVRERLRQEGVELDQQTGLHVIGLATVSGIAIQGPDAGRSPTLVRREDWLGKRPKFDRDKALAELARRYVGAFAPATDRDFAYWAGLNLGEVRRGLEAIGGELEEAETGGTKMLRPRGRRPRLPPAGQLRMLGNFDTYLLGWKDRGFSVPEHHAASVKEGGGGWIRPVIVRDGIVLGGWRSARSGGRIEVSIEPSSDLDADARRAIDAEIEDLARFEGVPVRLA